MLSVVSPPYGLFHCALSPAAGSDIPSGNFQRGHDEDLPSRHLKWSRPVSVVRLSSGHDSRAMCVKVRS
jgi:hypothetical protein